MIEINDYQISAQIYESANSIVYRGIRQQDNLSVILKMLKQDYPTPAQLTHYRQEYEITRSLNLEGVIKAYSLEEYQRTLVIILEDFGGNSLKILTNNSEQKQGITSLHEFLEIAIQAAEVLAQIHGANVIHKDINPANIIWHSDTKQLKIIDFGISSVLSRENPTLKNPNVLEGTLAYISPEQTGRMNRTLDYRTDFYSLGVTFYQLLAGRLPFETTDAMELVHCHIAKQPVPLYQIKNSRGSLREQPLGQTNNLSTKSGNRKVKSDKEDGIEEIPQTVSDIVMKLMAKTAEERYQSAWGLKADLEECLHQLQRKGTIEPFPLGTKDFSGKFQIPQKLYGREQEIQTLLAAFDRISGKNQSAEYPTTRSKVEMMLVAGYSGIGKSALVQELYKPITRDRGYFIKGKFDQFQRNIPYSAFVSAFAGAIRQLLTETETQLTQWRRKILAALSVNAQVIIDVIPDVELIVGKQPAVPALGPTESQNRFNFVFTNFIRLFCSREHPLAIFLDDLQWADSATLRLIELIMTDTEIEYLLLIGAYRDNEVSAAHPLVMALEELHKAGTVINQIALTPLTYEHINQLMVDTFNSNTETVKSLTELIFTKTNGNPFFGNELLKTLYSDRLLNFDLESRTWQWDISNIGSREIADNVVELMLSKLKKLPVSTQRKMRFAACIGAEFDLNTLSILRGQPMAEVFEHLKPAIQSGLILCLSELNEQLVIEHYKFGHDRIQQAAYALSDEAEKKATHLQIGRLLLEKSSTAKSPDQIFTIVDHLNLGSELISKPEERTKLAELNLSAGKKATSATAYEAAVKYFHKGLELLPENSWQSHYELARSLHELAAEATYLNGDFEGMQELASIVLQQAKTELDRVKVYEVQVQACIAQTRLRESVLIVLQAVRVLGIDIPEQPSAADIQQAITKAQTQWKNKHILDLVDLPNMSDPTILAAVRLLASANAPAYTGAPELLPLIVAEQVKLSIEYGNADASSLGYAFYGAMLSNNVGTIEYGYQFGQVALSLVEKFDDRQIKARTCDLVYGMIWGWKVHIKETLKPLENNYQLARDNGTFEYAGYSILKHCYYTFLTGEPLDELQQKLANYTQALAELKQFTAVNYLQRDRQAVLNLIEDSPNPGVLQGRVYDEQSKLPLYHQANDYYGLLYFYLSTLILSYLFQDYSQAGENAKLAKTYLDGGAGLAHVGSFHFYDSLTQLMLYNSATSEEQARILNQVRVNQEKMATWAYYAPMNYSHKFDLVAAEQHRILGEDSSAMDLYDRAIAQARKNHYINDEALACELAAKFWLAKGKERFAIAYINEARYAYAHWGATAKVKDLEARYPKLIYKVAAATRIIDTNTTTTSINTGTSSGKVLDIATVIKASQAISGVIFIEQLLLNLMKILIENAGAQVGFLILESQGQLLIEAEGSVDSEQVKVLQSIKIETSENLPVGLIQYVARTQEDVVLLDATNEGVFTSEPYIVKKRSKSILCAPIINQGKLMGILYLENNLTTGAFTPDRLEVLKILSSQAAISIENARLYQNLEYKVQERTAQLAEANQEISTLNELLTKDNLRMSAELDIVKQLQQMVLPKQSELEAIEGLEIAGFMQPADEVGGDYYDILQQDGQVKISIGDVTGHGLESGVLMIMAQTAVRTLQKMNETDPVKFLDVLNQTLYDNLQRMDCPKNMTLAILDYAGGVLKLSGQHEEMIVVRADGKLECIDTMDLGFPIGLVEEIGEFIAQAEVQLNPGDVVVLYTDGIPEAKDINKAQYGLKRLWQVVVENRHRRAREIREAVINDVRQYIGAMKVFDDITLVVMKQK